MSIEYTASKMAPIIRKIIVANRLQTCLQTCLQLQVFSLKINVFGL